MHLNISLIADCYGICRHGKIYNTRGLLHHIQSSVLEHHRSIRIQKEIPFQDYSPSKSIHSKLHIWSFYHHTRNHPRLDVALHLTPGSWWLWKSSLQVNFFCVSHFWLRSARFFSILVWYWLLLRIWDWVSGEHFWETISGFFLKAASLDSHLT